MSFYEFGVIWDLSRMTLGCDYDKLIVFKLGELFFI